jgi:hypothetical protein
MPVPIPVVHIAIGLGCIVLALPLILGRVGRNRWFGIRVEGAGQDDDRWRRVNAFGGRRLALFGLFLVAVGLLLRDSVPPPTSAWTPLILIAPLAPLLLVVRSVRRFAATLADGDKRLPRKPN